MSRRQKNLFPELPDGKKYVSDIPELMAQWHPTMNKGKKPEDYTHGSGAKVHWRCERGHEYTATISNRTKQKSGCPTCTRQSSSNELRILSELETLFHDVRSRHKVDGFEVDIFIKSLAVAIEYDGSYWHRDKSQKDAAKSDHLRTKGIKTLRVRESPLVKLEDWDLVLESSGPISKPNIDNIVRAICHDSAAEDYVSQHDFVNDEKYRTYLDYFPSPFPEKSLAALKPDIASEWDYEANAPLTPSNFTLSAAYNASWVCQKGHKWQSRIATRTGKKNHGCGYCSGRHATAENNLAVKNPELLAFWDYDKNDDIQPTEITPNSGRKIWWKCSAADDHVWEAVPYSMTIKTGGKFCPFCNGRKVSTTNCLATTHPRFVSIWHPTKNGDLNPWNVTAGSDKKVWFLCENNESHEYEGIIYNMTRPFRRKFCPHCKAK